MFVSDGIQVLDADVLPGVAMLPGPLPTAAEPSDHILLAASLRI